MSARDVVDALNRPQPPNGLTRTEWDELVRDLLSSIRDYMREEKSLGLELNNEAMRTRKRIWDLALHLREALDIFQPPTDLIRKFRYAGPRHTLDTAEGEAFERLVRHQADEWAQAALNKEPRL